MLFVVTNSSFAAMSPEQAGFNKIKPEYSNYTKVYFEEEDIAKMFAEWLAAKHNTRFYLMKTVGYCQPTQPPVKWEMSPAKEP